MMRWCPRWAQYGRSLANGNGVTVGEDGMAYNVSVNSKAGESLEGLSKGIPNKQIGVTTAGEIRAAGGTIDPAPTRNNPDHCLIASLAVVLQKSSVSSLTP
jgi:hypothetical protein